LWGYARLLHYHNQLGSIKIISEDKVEEEGLPYGPKWPLENIVKHIASVGYVYPDNYGTEESGYEIVDIADIEANIYTLRNEEGRRRKQKPFNSIFLQKENASEDEEDVMVNSDL